ncbi:tetratricopeptide repeat protein [Enterobacter sp. Cy-643]|uniref:NfrA family protein n=1 Tax=Enterobacter sp. Cy-643 TaxID=2608346 RepID=UPI0014215C4A|nr:tetratricopeptide repeat protein [Enterobacter sp. Cy-643]NIF31641.1 tetratricopeptide repeat protein [Enterobacter sp. Cy-643]
MKFCLKPLAVLTCGLMIAGYSLAATEGSKEDLGLSDYRYFKVYPHIERAQKALKANDEQRAISSFQHARELAPDSVRLTLWLAEAYRHFHHDDKAIALLNEQLRKMPGNAQVRQALDAIPRPAKNVTTREQLLAFNNECNASPSVSCRAEVGNFAVQLGALDIALQQFNDDAFRTSPSGHTLINNLTQRAIYLQEWQTADRGFALQDRLATLSEEQYQQWFAILLHLGRDRRILDLQQQGVMNTPGMQLAYAQSLAERKKHPELENYLSSHKPAFDTDSEKHNWRYLMVTWGGMKLPEAALPVVKPKPLSAAEIRMAQARVLKDQCDKVITLLGDMSPQYDAQSWSHLAECYQQTAPGMALYAARQAQSRDANPYYARQVAYLAFAVEDYALAQSSLRSVPVKTLSDEDIRAAARSAWLAKDSAALDYWRQVAWQRAMPELNFESPPEQDHATRGFALFKAGDMPGARGELEQALQTMPDSPEILRQMVYINQRLDDKPQTKRYSERVVDDIDHTLTPSKGLTDAQQKERFAFRRVHEDSQRRWTFSFDSSLGLTSASKNEAGAGSGVSRDRSNRSYGQAEAEYRIGQNQILNGDQLSVYTRLFGGSAGHSNIAPVYQPMVGMGVRWKPLREQVIYLAVEQQLPLDKAANARTDMMLRASASFLNGGEYSDDWHPLGKGWFAQNLYLDAAHFVKYDYQLYTADYRQSWHQKVSDRQTVEPYWHLQYNNQTRHSRSADNRLGGVGVRYNTWFGETHYDAYPHKASVGLEYQRVFDGRNRDIDSKNSLFLTIGVRW